MSITAKITADGKFLVEQKKSDPMIYLDHWAIRMFSEEAALQDRFVRALHACNGNLLVTVQNVVEFSQMSDQAQAARTEGFFDRALPNLYFVDAVLEAGYMLPASQFMEKAHELDKWQGWMLRQFESRCIANGNRLSTAGLLQQMVLHGKELADEFRRTNDAVADAVKLHRADSDKMRAARFARPQANTSLRHTVAAEMMRDTYLNPRAAFTSHDASDIVHAIPAAVACKLAMLDRKWCDKLEKVRQRFKTHGIRAPLAQVFSHRHGGVERLLQAMKEFSPTS